MNRSRALLCLLSCGGGSLCTATCLQKHSDLSPWIGKSLSCAHALALDGSSSLDSREACWQNEDTSRELSPFQTGFVGVLASLTKCSVNQCENGYSKFLQASRRVFPCMDTCRLFGRDDPTPDQSLLPNGFLCALRCVLLAQE